MDRSPRTVLLAEDDSAIQDMMQHALSEAGFRVITTDNGADAVTLALAEHPDVILIDIEMPGLDGHEAVRQIRADRWGATARVIYLTNFSEPEDVYHAVTNRSAEFIVKANTPVREIINHVRLASYSDQS